MSIKKRQKRSALLAYIILAVGAVFMIIPFLWMVLTSFKTYRETVKLPIQWFPAEWNFDNYVEVLKQLDFLRYYRNHDSGYGDNTCGHDIDSISGCLCFCKNGISGKKCDFCVTAGCLYGSASDDHDPEIYDESQNWAGSIHWQVS